MSRNSPDAEPPAPTPRERLHDTFFLLLAMVLLTPFSVLLLLVALLTGFQARRVYSEVMVRALSRSFLWLGRVRLQVHGSPPPRGRQVFYMPNHPSVFDVFTFTSLGLPNTRFFMSRGVWIYLPFAFTSWLMGVFFTPPQSNTAARVRCFQRAERHLRASGESVLGTPEGRVVPAGLGPFNRGVFHLAIALGCPIVPIYVDFLPGDNPGLGYTPRRTTVGVHFLPEIPTADWTLAELETHKEAVRARFLEFAARLASAQDAGA